MNKRPNIVLICTDQQRMDSLACYGNQFVKSPNIDRFAKGATRFTQAFTPWPVCTPARATMWTGVYPHLHGVIDNVYGVEDAFASHSKIKATAIDAIHQAGYLTAHFGKWHLGDRQPASFDIWEESFNSRQGHWIDGLREGIYRPDQQTNACVRFLETQQGGTQPFLMIQSYYPPHDPYTAPAKYYEHYRGRGIPFAGYYAAVTALDACTGKILDALDRTGHRENTIVIYFTDHGDTFWYRKEGEHKFVCFDDAIRIPFLVRGPNVVSGAIRDEHIGLQDISPTIMDYAGVSPSPDMHGMSLRPLLEGRTVPWREGFYVQNITHVSSIVQRCIRTQEWKLIAAENGEHQLFDLITDPEEELDIFLTPRPDPGFERYKHLPDHATVIKTLCDQMEAEATRISDAIGLKLATMVRAAIAPRLHKDNADVAQTR